MEIIVGKSAGFCYGVKRAVDGAKEEAMKSKMLYGLGEIVHNKDVVKKLKDLGINFIEDLEEAKEMTKDSELGDFAKEEVTRLTNEKESKN